MWGEKNEQDNAPFRDVLIPSKRKKRASCLVNFRRQGQKNDTMAVQNVPDDGRDPKARSGRVFLHSIDLCPSPTVAVAKQGELQGGLVRDSSSPCALP